MQFLGVNPLQNSFDIYLKADYVVNDSIAKVQNRLRKIGLKFKLIPLFHFF
jgi:cell division transport system permease protein